MDATMEIESGTTDGFGNGQRSQLWPHVFATFLGKAALLGSVNDVEMRLTAAKLVLKQPSGKTIGVYFIASGKDSASERVVMRVVVGKGTEIDKRFTIYLKDMEQGLVDEILNQEFPFIFCEERFHAEDLQTKRDESAATKGPSR